MINWDQVLDNVSWLNFSAICPAIGEQTADICLEAVRAAVARGIQISIDLNYRSRLWQYGKRPIDVMPALLPYCDLVMGNIWSAETMLGIMTTRGLSESSVQKEYLQAGLASSKKIIEQFPKCKSVANTYRFSTDQHLQYYTSLFTKDTYYTSKTYQTDNMVHKVGSGDCFMAGLIYGYYYGNDPQAIIDFATAAAFSKLFESGDFTSNNTVSITKFINHHV
jgi:2-dehydro-3-deoxygluconokinase